MTAPERTRLADPTPFAFALFAFALAIYGVRFVNVSATTIADGPVTVGLNYALLAAAIGESLAGLLAIVRGDGYPAWVLSTFGIWLIGFFLLAQFGTENEHFTPDAFAWYILLLIVPLAILTVPAIVHRNHPFVIAFIALIAMLLLAGLGFHSLHNAITDATASKTPPDLSTAVNLVKTSAWFGFASALAVWGIFAREVFQATGVIRSAAPSHTAARPVPSTVG